jgi:hypothetical protein
MSAAEIKQAKLSLIAWIEQLSDINTLAFLEEIKESKSSKDWWDDLSESQKENINEGIKDVEEGRTVSSAEFWKILKNG